MDKEVQCSSRRDKVNIVPNATCLQREESVGVSHRIPGFLEILSEFEMLQKELHSFSPYLSFFLSLSFLVTTNRELQEKEKKKLSP